MPDCPEGDDEGEIVKCNFAGKATPNGCCAFHIIKEMGVTIECAFTGSSNESGRFQRETDNSHFISSWGQDIVEPDSYLKTNRRI